MHESKKKIDVTQCAALDLASKQTAAAQISSSFLLKTNRQTDRQIDRQTDKQTGRGAYGQTCMQASNDPKDRWKADTNRDFKT